MTSITWGSKVKDIVDLIIAVKAREEKEEEKE